jgi:SAM-dependent methyltransferase
MKIDLGCGSSKRPGFIGIDISPAPGVDHILDIVRDPLPFGDNSVDHVYSSHCFEHLVSPINILSEIGRVCKDDATIEICVPYGHHNDGLLCGHITFYTEEFWHHLTLLHPDVWLPILKGRWLWTEVNYVIGECVLRDIERYDFPMDFAIRYFNNIVKEFTVTFLYKSNLSLEPTFPKRYFSPSRGGNRHTLPFENDAPVRDDFVTLSIADLDFR